MTEFHPDKSVLIQEITPNNLLSFGPNISPVRLGALNVFIGPNGSGKSNLIEAIGLLRSTARDIRKTILDGGGVTEWIWKGKADQPASIDAVISNPNFSQPLRHVFTFRAEQQSFRLEDERIENEKAYGKTDPYFYYHYQQGRPLLNVKGEKRELKREDIVLNESILTQRRDPENYPEISYLTDVYEKIRIYREWQFGRKSEIRKPQPANSRNDFLEENYLNLGMFLNRIRLKPKSKKTIIDNLRDLYDGVEDFEISTVGGTVQVFFIEGDYSIPGTRLSDGSLRYLCLLAILNDPTPPPLICIEEPELGLHPDILPKLAQLLIEASHRTQLIVTTHSDIIVDALTDYPQTVFICEKHNGETQIERLNPDKLAEWLKNYRLGQLWMQGDLGGTRW